MQEIVNTWRRRCLVWTGHVWSIYDGLLVKAGTSKSSHQWRDTSHSRCYSLAWCYSAWPAPSCHYPRCLRGSHSLVFSFYRSSCRADCTCSNYSTTTQPVGCAFSSWFSLNVSQFPGFTVRHTQPFLSPNPKKQNKYSSCHWHLKNLKISLNTWFNRLEMIIFAPRCKQILRQHWGDGWIQALPVVEGLLGCFHSAHCGRKCPDYQFWSLYSCKPVSLIAARLRVFRLWSCDLSPNMVTVPPNQLMLS